MKPLGYIRYLATEKFALISLKEMKDIKPTFHLSKNSWGITDILKDIGGFYFIFLINRTQEENKWTTVLYNWATSASSSIDS